MLKSSIPKALRAIETDIGDLSTVLAWNSVQHIANAAVTSRKQDGSGRWVSMSGEERLLHLRNALLMELTGRVDDDEELWRVTVTVLGVTALYIGLGTKPELKVDDLSDLPKWMQERVVVLSMLTERPPTKPIEGVGRRISDTVYWIVK
jgi:hypothetical protein